MSKKMMLLAVGALTALAFTALAGAAAAKEPKLKCEGEGRCTFEISGLETKFSISGGDTVRCSFVNGWGEVVNLNAERESSTSTVQLLYAGCQEQNTIFHFACSNSSGSGNITTNLMTMHSVAVPGAFREAGMLITNAGLTFTCAGGFAATEVKGSIIGESETWCGSNTGKEQKVSFSTAVTEGDGAQSLTTYTGNTFKLEARTSHINPESKYASAAQAGTTNLFFNQNVLLTCA